MLTLLPRKEFEFTLDDGTIIKGKFCLWSIKRFCDKLKLSLSQLSERLTEDKVTFDDTCQILLCAVEYKVRKEGKPFSYNDIDACEWIESLGGFEGEEYKLLMKHAHAEDEKKNPEAQLSGESLRLSATVQD
jgi:hypothetical protein